MKYFRLFEDYHPSQFEIAGEIFHLVWEPFTGGATVKLFQEEKELGDLTLEGTAIVDAQIIPEYRGKGLYQRMLLFAIHQLQGKKLSSVFRSPEAERAWNSFLKKLPLHYHFEKIEHPGEGVTEILCWYQRKKA